jgi:pyruvate ferredoxin oxidoreductase beta subunit
MRFRPTKSWNAKTVENDRYQFTEYVSEEAKQYLTERYGYKEFLAKPAAPAAAIPGKA